MVKRWKLPILTALSIAVLGVSPGILLAQDLSLALYGGRLSREKWEGAIAMVDGKACLYAVKSP